MRYRSLYLTRILQRGFIKLLSKLTYEFVALKQILTRLKDSQNERKNFYEIQ